MDMVTRIFSNQCQPVWGSSIDFFAIPGNRLHSD